MLHFVVRLCNFGYVPLSIPSETHVELSLGLAGAGIIAASSYFYFRWCHIKKEDTEGQELDKTLSAERATERELKTQQSS